MAGLQAMVNDGAIILFGGGMRPPQFLPPPIIDAGDQPAAEKTQGYPETRGLLATYSGPILASQGVHIDELKQR